MSHQSLNNQHQIQRDNNEEDVNEMKKFCEQIKNLPLIQNYIAQQNASLLARIAELEREKTDLSDNFMEQLQKKDLLLLEVDKELRDYKANKTTTETLRISDGLIKKSDDQLTTQYRNLKQSFDDFAKQLMKKYLSINTEESRDLLKFKLIACAAGNLLIKNGSESLEFDKVLETLELDFERLKCRTNSLANIREDFLKDFHNLFELSQQFFQEITTREEQERRDDGRFPLKFYLSKAKVGDLFDQSQHEVPNSCRDESNETISFVIYPSFTLKDLDNNKERILVKHYVFTSLRQR
jgi:hypothetical protein